MASNRSNTTARSAGQPTRTETPKDALGAVARRTAHIQIAAVTAAGTTLAGWAHAADRFAQAIGDELLRRVDGDTDSGELIVGVASATSAHLRDLTTLPSTAANHFNTRLSRVSTDN